MEKKKLKIAMIGHKRIPSREGGVEVVVEQLASRMVQLGHQVTCFNRKGHHVSGKEFDSKKMDCYQGIQLKHVFTLDKKGLAAITSAYSAAFMAAFGDYDIVHFHAEGPCAAMWICKLMKKKCIATIHGLDHQRGKWGKIARMVIMAGEKTAVSCADELIVLSENVKNYFMETYQRSTTFISNGVHRPEIVAANLIMEDGLEKDSYFLYLGRLVPEKGIEYLINAYKQIDTQKKLVIAGGSSDTETYASYLKELAKEDHRITFTGFVQGRKLQELFSNAYVYVLPSDLEGMPLSLLEAMSYGNCVLTSDIPECTEVVGDDGLSFRKSDIQDLKEKLEMCCLDSDLVQQLKAEAQNKICTRYNWDDVVEKTLMLYCGKENT